VRAARHVDLSTLRAAHTSFLKTLGKKTRAHIRHTSEVFSRYGDIKIEVAGTVEQALQYLEEMKILHQRRWAGRGQPGAFIDGHFNRFHERLITDFFASNVIQLLRVTAGSRTIGILYNFVHNSDVLVYQTGFNYDLVVAKNKESPGLLTHALAVDYNASRGYARYDLLAGDSEYKRALAKESSELWWGTVQRDSLKFRVERLLQQVWWKLRVTFAWGAIAWVCEVPCADLLLLA
jgi:CelD/BcsL family acetyltransferase involved in cellulose biosynthesis